MTIYYYDTKYGRFIYNTEEEPRNAIQTNTENKAIKIMLECRFRHCKFFVNDRKEIALQKKQNYFSWKEFQVF